MGDSIFFHLEYLELSENNVQMHIEITQSGAAQLLFEGLKELNLPVYQGFTLIPLLYSHSIRENFAPLVLFPQECSFNDYSALERKLCLRLLMEAQRGFKKC